MIAFTAAAKPTGGNFNLSGGNGFAGDAAILPLPQNVGPLARASYAINATDFTKDEYD